MARISGRTHEGTEESKQRILDATMQLTTERGYEGTTIALVSKRSGLPSGSVYWHFGSKDNLFVALVERTFEQWRSQTLVAADGGGDARDTLVRIMAAATDEHDPSQGFWRLGLILALERRMQSSAARQSFLTIRNRVIEEVTRTWSRSLPAEVVEHDPALPRRVARLVMAAADGLYVSISAGEQWHQEALATMFVEAIDALIARQLTA